MPKITKETGEWGIFSKRTPSTNFLKLGLMAGHTSMIKLIDLIPLSLRNLDQSLQATQAKKNILVSEVTGNLTLKIIKNV